jgi:hypothetical protein
MIMDETYRYGWILTITIVIALLYIGGVALLVFNARSIIDARLTVAQNQATTCVNDAINALNLFIATENLAVQNALCSYPALCPTENIEPLDVAIDKKEIPYLDPTFDYDLWNEQVLAKV